MVLLPTSFSMHYLWEVNIYNINKEDPETTREIFRRTQKNSKDNIQAKDPFHYKCLQKIQDYRSYKTQWTRHYDEQGSKKEHDSGNDYALLVATRQNTLYSTILFSSKEGCSASKIGVSGTTRQHGPGESRKHQSTQVRCNAGSDADLYWTVTNQSERINLELLDEGMHPAS
jgi:hypothetical protein